MSSRLGKVTNFCQKEVRLERGTNESLMSKSRAIARSGCDMVYAHKDLFHLEQASVWEETLLESQGGGEI